MTVTSEVDIANLALDRLKEQSITSFDQERSAARWMGRNYAPTRDMTLAAHPWKFAMARAELAEDAAAPLFGWTRKFKLPDNIIRLQPLRVKGLLDGRLIKHEVEAGYILTDASAPLRVRYIQRVEDVPTMAREPLFIDALAASLAARMAHWMTGKETMVEALTANFQETLASARTADSVEGTHAAQYANAYTDARWLYAGHGHYQDQDI